MPSWANKNPFYESGLEEVFAEQIVNFNFKTNQTIVSLKLALKIVQRTVFNFSGRFFDSEKLFSFPQPADAWVRVSFSVAFEGGRRPDLSLEIFWSFLDLYVRWNVHVQCGSLEK